MNALDQVFADLYARWQQRQLSEANLATLFFIYGYAETPRLKRDFIALGSNPSVTQLADFLSSHQIRGVRGKAIVALQNWLTDKWPLVLREQIPSPYEVLAAQSEGWRPVSMLYRVGKLHEPIGHRCNAFDFLVHDLEHAAMFFADPQLFSQQRDFFSRVKQSWDQGMWEPFLGDAEFVIRFHYMMSDMNSHPEHYRKYLRAVVIEFYLRAEGKLMSEPLTPEHQNAVEELFKRVSLF